MPPERASNKQQNYGIKTEGCGVKNVHTKLFVKWMKRKKLLRAVNGILRNKFNTFPFFGPRLVDNTCEILLKPCTSSSSSSGAKFVESKEYLQYAMKIIMEPASKTVEKEPELIDLEESDNECNDEIIEVFDESLQTSINEMESNNLIEKEKCQINANSNADLDDSDIIIVDVINNSNIESINKLRTESVLRETNRQENKRKPNSDVKNDCKSQVVEILDDSVIVLDDSFCIPSSTTYKNRSPKVKDTFSENSIGNSCFHSPIKNASNWSEAKSTNKIPSLSSNNVTNYNGISDPLFSSSSAQDSANSTNVNHPIKNANMYNSRELEVQNIISSPPKKKSKLTYKRPAHLNTPLIQPVSASTSCGSVSNIFSLKTDSSLKRSGLRPIVIDGNNVAISHGKGNFSLKGIQICIKYFERRGHEQIKVFLPCYRVNRDNNQELNKMERQGIIVLTPSRKVQGRILSSYDDRYIVQYATEVGGVIVSKDNFRDLLSENPDWKDTIENRLLMFTWVDDLLMFPVDPLGRNGPSLDEFLRFPDT